MIQSSDLTIDFGCLYFQIAILMVIIVREIARPSQRNIFAILISGGFLILVSGQALWMFSKFSDNGTDEILHLLQPISLRGAQLANYFASIAVICYGIIYRVRDKRRVVDYANLAVRYHRLQPSYLSYLFLYGWVIAMAIGVIVLAGGVIETIVAPGLNFSYGVTMFLIFISIGKFPLLQKLASNKEILLFDVWLFLVALLITLFNSRILVGMMLLQLVVIFNYCHREISRRALLMIPTILFLVFIVFGLYREYASLSVDAIDPEALLYFTIDYADVSTLLDWFYGANVEGFAGLAGIVTYDASVGGIVHDLGLSNLSFLTQFIPGVWRNDPTLPFKTISDALASMYPYEGSIVRPGLEIAYANYGVLGIIAFGSLLGYLTQFLHSAMTQANCDRLRMGVISVQSLRAIRGTFAHVIYFGLSDLIMLSLYRFLLKISQGAVVNQTATRVSHENTDR